MELIAIILLFAGALCGALNQVRPGFVLMAIGFGLQLLPFLKA